MLARLLHLASPIQQFFTSGYFCHWHYIAGNSIYGDRFHYCMSVPSIITIYQSKYSFYCPVAQRYPEYVKRLMWASLVICVGSLALSSFATKVCRSAISHGVFSIWRGSAGLASYYSSRDGFWCRCRSAVRSSPSLDIRLVRRPKRLRCRCHIRWIRVRWLCISTDHGLPIGGGRIPVDIEVCPRPPALWLMKLIW